MDAPIDSGSEQSNPATPHAAPPPAPDAAPPTPPPVTPVAMPVVPAATPIVPAATPVAVVAAEVEEYPHSGLGITSLVIAGVVAIGIFIVFVIAGVLHAQGRGPRDAGVMMVGLLTIAMLFVDVVALGLGIGALCQKRRRKLFGVLGVVISGCILLGTIGLMLIGLMMQHRME